MSRPDPGLCTCAGGRPCYTCSTAGTHNKPRPNLRDAKPCNHKDHCKRAAFLKGEVGDVRECEHGKIQVVEQPYINSPGHLVWRDLHWFWDRRQYRLAKRLLQEATVRHVYGEGQQRRARGALEIKPMTARPTPPSRGQRKSATTTPAAIRRLEKNYGDDE